MKIFHHDDHDGKLSKFWTMQAINMGRKLVPDKFGVTYYEMCYEGRKEYPFDEIQQNEQVIILDYKIAPSDYDTLTKITDNILYIDHHIKTINILEEHCKKTAKPMPLGLYMDGVSASALTALWFFSEEFIGWDTKDPQTIKEAVCKLPLFAQYVNDFDIWAKQMPDSNKFMYGSLAKIDDMALWKSCFDENVVAKIIAIGAEIEAFTLDQYKRDYNLFKYTCDVTDPKYKEFKDLNIILLNTTGKGTMKFLDGIHAYDLCIGYTVCGDRVQLGLYSESPKVDCSKLAKLLDKNGGGHPGASGCAMPIDLFFKIFKHKGA